MSSMPKDVKDVGTLLATVKMVQTLMDIFDAGEKASPEVKNFLMPFMQEVVETKKSLETLFGKDFEGK